MKWARMGTPLRRSLTALAALVALVALAPAIAAAQSPTPARDRFAVAAFEPTPAGDRFYRVESPELLGHGAIDAQLLASFALRPFAVERPAADGGRQSIPVVPSQLFLHPGLALTLWSSLKLSLDLPLGSASVVADVESPGEETDSEVTLGDLRAGARLRIFGDPADDLRASISGALWLPTGDESRFAGEGVVRGSSRLVLGGRIGSVTWGATGVVVFRPPAEAAGVTFGRQLDGDIGFSLPVLRHTQLLLEGRVAAVVEGEDAWSRQTTQTDLLLGMRVRIDDVVGGIGIGFGSGVGGSGPSILTVLSLAYAPLERASGDASEPPSDIAPPTWLQNDSDGDGQPDHADPCPDARGATHGPTPGCPDADGDGVTDASDACPARPGSPSTRGCVVEDTDSDQIPDADDACPGLPGPPREISREHGCPEDQDSDGVSDSEDACPNERGHFSLHPERNGCPREDKAPGR